ncbi:RNase H family protein [Senna tora]|uniref:RNase H family protein n=1 Tax=Senna tora TaxID=362788 RepID=A0A834SY26_9FABA|nr:RNase H family protein [Senna tora]
MDTGAIMTRKWSTIELISGVECVEDKSFWQKIWKLPILPKYRVFLWRACLGILPTSSGMICHAYGCERWWRRLGMSSRSYGGGVIGRLIRDSSGACMAAFVEPRNFPHDPMLLEALAILRGVEMARESGVRNLVIESDSKIVVPSWF